MKTLIDYLKESYDLQKEIKLRSDYEQAIHYSPVFYTSSIVDIINKIKGNKQNLDKIDWENEYFDQSHYEEYYDKVVEVYKKNFLDLSSIIKWASMKECFNVDDMDMFTTNGELRYLADLDDDDCGFVIHQDGDDADWGIFVLKKKVISPKERKIINDFFSMFDSSVLEWTTFTKYDGENEDEW